MENDKCKCGCEDIELLDKAGNKPNEIIRAIVEV